MTARTRVARTQSQLRVVLLLSAFMWTGAALLAVLAIELVAGAWAHSARLHDWDWDIALAVGVAAGCWVLWRGRYVFSARRVAMWMEERVPSLQYALVTASDPKVTGDLSLLESAIDQSNVDTFLRPAILTPVIYSGVALSVMAGAFAAALTLAAGRAPAASRNNSGGIPPDASVANRLLGLKVQVKLPAYAGGTTSSIDDPSAITALAGSRILVSGSTTAGVAGITGSLGERALSIGESGRGWQSSFQMPERPTTVTFVDRDYDRVIAIIPVIDEPPKVQLLQPSRDTVWRHVPSGPITFVARASDDIGLANGHVEYTVTTGSGEIFKSRTSSLATERFRSAHNGDLRASIDPSRLGLGEGAILSVRAVVTDNNTLYGPATATSDTRTFRVARSDEYDSLAVEAAPPPPTERSLLTQRMLIVSAESLLKKRPALAAREYVASSGRIGADQADLRKKVYNILYEQDEAGGDGGVEGDDEELDPQLVLNHDLKQAYDAMWDAERSLNIGEISVALPFMRRAASALDRARLANRLYLRGRPPRVVVNIEKVRLTGKDKGSSNTAAGSRSRADSAARVLDRSLDSALTIANTDRQHFVDALIRLRARAAVSHPEFAVAIGAAVDSLRADRDATNSLIIARRALFGAPRNGNPMVPWSGGWIGPKGDHR